MTEQNGKGGLTVPGHDEASQRALATVKCTDKGLVFQDLEGMFRFSQYVARSGFAPKGMTAPESIMIAIQMGQEIGLAPMQAVQNIAVINGRPSVWGDAALALCKSHASCEDVVETIEGTGDNLTAICVAKRKGCADVEQRFSVADAKRAGLYDKPGPWKQYTRRMLQVRARGFALRDAFPDLLKGMVTVEEARDYGPRDVTHSAWDPEVEEDEDPSTDDPVALHAAMERLKFVTTQYKVSAADIKERCKRFKRPLSKLTSSEIQEMCDSICRERRPIEATTTPQDTSEAPDGPAGPPDGTPEQESGPLRDEEPPPGDDEGTGDPGPPDTSAIDQFAEPAPTADEEHAQKEVRALLDWMDKSCGPPGKRCKKYIKDHDDITTAELLGAALKLEHYPEITPNEAQMLHEALYEPRKPKADPK